MEIDLAIALLEKQDREDVQEAINAQDSARYDLKKLITYSLEELIAGIKSGKQYLYALKMLFEPRDVLNGRWKIPQIIDFFDIVSDEPETLIMTSSKRKVSNVFSMAAGGRMEPPFTEWIAHTKKTLRGMNLYMKLDHSDTVNQMEYFCYELPTSEGITYNVHFRCLKQGVLFSGALNCMNKDKDGMGLLLEAMIHVMEEMNR